MAISAIADFAQRYPAEAEVLRQNPDAIKAAIVGGASDQTRNHEDRKDLDMVFGEGYIAEGVRDPAVGAAIDRLQNHINSFANRDGAIGDMQAMQGDLMPGYSSVDITNEVKQALGIQTQPSAEQSPAAKPGGATEEVDYEAIFDAAAAEVGAAPAAGGIQKGEVGGKMGSGEVVLTASGRRTTPFPQIKSGPRGTATTVKAVDGWLMQNALDEARSRGDKFNARQFEQNLAKPSKADKDGAEEYLFGQQPAVPRPLLTPLSPQATTNDGAAPKATQKAPAPSAAPNASVVAQNGANSVNPPAASDATQDPDRNQDGVSINDVKPSFLRGVVVPMKLLVGSEKQTVEVSANQAIADLDEEIAVYEKLLACVKAVA